MTITFTDSFIPFLEATLREALTRANAAADQLWKLQTDPIIPEKILSLQTRATSIHLQLVRSCNAVLRCLVFPSPSDLAADLGRRDCHHTPSADQGQRLTTQNSNPKTPPSSALCASAPLRESNSDSAPVSNSGILKKILDQVPHDLAWRPSKDRLLCRRKEDAVQKDIFTRLATKHVLYGPTYPDDDGWPLEDHDWMLAADIFERKKAKLPIPTGWEVVKIRNWLDAYTRVGGGDPKLKKELREKLPQVESAWRAELHKYFCRPEDAETLRTALVAFNLEPGSVNPELHEPDSASSVSHSRPTG